MTGCHHTVCPRVLHPGLGVDRRSCGILAQNNYRNRLGNRLPATERSRSSRRPMETATPVEMTDGGPSADVFLIISTAACKGLRTQRSGFRTVTTGPAAVSPLQSCKGGSNRNLDSGG